MHSRTREEIKKGDFVFIRDVIRDFICKVKSYDDVKEQTFLLQSLKKFPSYRILGVVSYPLYRKFHFSS